MLSINSDAKTIKGIKRGYLTGILYLAPHSLSGVNVCPNASPGCIASCLYSAGRGAFSNVQAARMAKTKLLFENRDEFFLRLFISIEALVRRAKREGKVPVVRLNGTSDLPWEKMKIMGDSVMGHFPTLQFYDYTKTLSRVLGPRLKNYHLTFSASEINEDEQLMALDAGYNVATVFKEVPDVHLGYHVEPGDDTDLRFLDQQGVVISLTPKGRARKLNNGFVV